MMNLEKINCWVVTEGLKGTENQCIGVAEALGLSPVVKQVLLRWPWNILSPWLGLENRWIFKPHLDAPWPDLLIVSGRKSIAVARYIKRHNPACFTVFTQDPRINPAEFDLVIAPSHDRVTGDNVARTLAAPNRIRAEALAEAARQWPQLSTLPGQKLAVLIGGNSKAHRLTPATCLKLAKQLKVLDASLMVTVSRRTGAENEAILRKGLQGERVFFWDGVGDNPYFAMLGAADTVLVTNDSASMLSEASSTGKPVYAVPLEGGGTRIDQMQRNLIEHGAVRVFDGVLEDWDYAPLNDAQIAADAIKEALYKR